MCMLCLCCLTPTLSPLISGHNQFPSSYTFLSIFHPSGHGRYWRARVVISMFITQRQAVAFRGRQQNGNKTQERNKNKTEKKSQDIQFRRIRGQPVVRPVCALILGRGPIWGQGYATLPSPTPVWLQSSSPPPLTLALSMKIRKWTHPPVCMKIRIWTHPPVCLHLLFVKSENSKINSFSSLLIFLCK